MLHLFQVSTRPSGISRSVDGLFVADVSAQFTGPVFKGRVVEEE
jgi:hypothetical protein